MSKFVNYDDVSENYDSGRKAPGVDVIVGLIKTHCRKDIGELRVLDAGCGTGNYAVGLLKYGVNRISLLDGSYGMLKQALKKIDTTDIEKSVDFKQAILPRIPYNDNTFDVVMINQVLHHLCRNPDGNYFPEIIDFLNEANRVIRSSGLLVITATTKEQMSGIWHCCLNRECLRRYNLKLPTAKSFISMLNNTKFDVLNFLSVLGNDVTKRYTDVEAPFDKKYRESDSYWSVFNDKELKETLDYLYFLKNTNKLLEFYEEHDKSLEKGYFSIIVGKPHKNG